MTIGPLDIGLTIGPAQAAKIIDDEIDVLIVAVRHNRRGPVPTHTPPRQANSQRGFKPEPPKTLQGTTGSCGTFSEISHFFNIGGRKTDAKTLDNRGYREAKDARPTAENR
jgi:hypothetical protein